ncbi:MAG: transcriptional repressor [Actinomycetota bacterium]|nr:transcriptional repressor [Actinomycetota bacterium]
MRAVNDLDLTTPLRERGMRVTSQRVLVHRALRELDRHVTAEELLTAVAERLPNVSLPTIYATLELLEELGMVRRVELGAGATLFDPRTDPHHHMICETCGAIDDLDAELHAAPLLQAGLERGFAPDRVEAVLRGRCRSCSAGG